GRVENGDIGDLACDHYQRFESDVALMHDLGLNSYRFSISWSRIFPEGTGRLNQKGLDFYQKLVDLLLQNKIQPAITLFHWDLPAALDDRGGWLNPEIPYWFGEYAATMFRALDDRVNMWATLNEPWVITDGGYLHGALAPGHRNFYEAPIASHNLLRAHSAAVQTYRAEGKHQIGIVVNIEPKYPASESSEDLVATRRAEAYMNRQYLEPIFHGKYPQEMKEIFGDAWPEQNEIESHSIRQPVDFLGVNYYTRSVTRHCSTVLPVKAAAVRKRRSTYTETGWEVYPLGLTDTLLWVKQHYGNTPIYITENGAAFYDPPVSDSEIQDSLRVNYLKEHLRALSNAIVQGVDVRGYFVWSLLDNFEWSLGYSKRFGIVHVDYETQKRTPKASARFYSEVIRSNGSIL
ncbi:GH1 family beta-glucosidase, partial [bacterium]|nr:GH1 family beta-glucosidase [bacterium]